MKRITLLASVATLAAAPAFAQQSDESSSDQTMQNQNSNQEMAQSGDSGSMNQNQNYASGTMGQSQLDNMLRTSNIVGGDIYAVDVEDEWAEEEWNELEFVEAIDSNWEDIGNITDVVLSPDGRQVGLIISHGGFLDIGDDTVLLSMEDVRRIGSIDSLDGDYNYVVRMTEDQIESMPEVEENWY